MNGTAVELEKALDGNVGRYELSREDVLTVIREDDQLLVKRDRDLS